MGNRILLLYNREKVQELTMESFMSDSSNNYNQLIELSVLDAYGLLEPIEVDLFNRAFHEAPAAIQEEIIQLQESLALDDSLLPTELPSKALKQRVLDAVADAADQEAKRLAPLALIGARSGASRRNVPSSKQTIFWRTAAMVLLGVSVVLAMLAVDAQRRVSNMALIALNSETSDALSQNTGPGLSSFIGNPYCYIKQLEREQGGEPGYIRVAINERTGQGYILAMDLKEGEAVVINGTTPDGEVIEIARITADSPIIGRAFELDPAIGRTIVFHAVDASTGNRWV